ncbi:TIGR03111 family XrtG-associated glycosyltransferase [Clostridium paraputrificum]|uniref:TIGR03111 family XrtG-associated glycosyltransferase n=1 Tax=Clostridium TaxID=1485 RepID=UPI003D34A1BC
MEKVLEGFTFWGVWLVIPILVDIFSGILSVITVFIRYLKKEKENKLEYCPYVTILVPVYNSEKTLRTCIESITKQEYPIKNIQVLLIDNGSKDNSYDIYCELQERYTSLRLWWLDSSQGKAKALNKGLYMAEGKYIINIDSDGMLDKNAIHNMVYKFENDDEIIAMTGVILTNYKDIEKTKSISKRIFQKCELFEYCEAFLVGRGFQSQTNTMFTLAGACSAFRKDAVLKTQLYNGETLGEDTHMTSQIREFLNGKVVLCEDAFFFVDPIDDLDKLYIQRQRWQRGEIEVSTLFWARTKKKGIFNVLNYNMLKDHTLVFPRLIWYFAMFYLVFMDYPLELILGANIIMYIVYFSNSTIQYFVGRLYLKDQIETKKYMNKNLYILLILPIYRMLVFFMRAAGILNAAESGNSWNAKTFEQEKEIIKGSVKDRTQLYRKVKHWVNNGK